MHTPVMTAIIKIFQMEVPMLWSSQQIPRFARLIAASIWALTIPVLSLLPTKGIPLPLISSGGTSIFVTLSGIGILLNISRYVGLK